MNNLTTYAEYLQEWQRQSNTEDCDKMVVTAFEGGNPIKVTISKMSEQEFDAAWQALNAINEQLATVQLKLFMLREQADQLLSDAHPLEVKLLL